MYDAFDKLIFVVNDLYVFHVSSIHYASMYIPCTATQHPETEYFTITDPTQKFEHLGLIIK